MYEWMMKLGENDDDNGLWERGTRTSKTFISQFVHVQVRSFSLMLFLLRGDKDCCNDHAQSIRKGVPHGSSFFPFS
jgi:hypothetical protein